MSALARSSSSGPDGASAASSDSDSSSSSDSALSRPEDARRRCWCVACRGTAAMLADSDAVETEREPKRMGHPADRLVHSGAVRIQWQCSATSRMACALVCRFVRVCTCRSGRDGSAAVGGGDRSGAAVRWVDCVRVRGRPGRDPERCREKRFGTRKQTMYGGRGVRNNRQRKIETLLKARLLTAPQCRLQRRRAGRKGRRRGGGGCSCSSAV